VQTETTELTYDVFISYAGPDQESANELCEKFENEGLRCWIAPRNVRAGQKYLEEILDGVIRSKCLMLLLSENTEHAEYVENEVERAKSYRRKIYTLRLEEVQIPKNLELILGATQWIDSWAVDYPERLKQIIANVKQAETPHIGPIKTNFSQKLFRKFSKNILGIATVAILLFFVVMFYSMTSNNTHNQISSQSKTIPELVAKDFNIKINHIEYADKYQIQFTLHGTGLMLSKDLIGKQYYYNLAFDNDTNVRALSGLLSAQFEIPDFKQVPENVQLVLEDLDGEKTSPMNFSLRQLSELIKTVEEKKFTKLTKDFNKNGKLFCSFINPMYAKVKVCQLGPLGQGKKYPELLSYIKFISYGDQQSALTNKVNLQTLTTQGIAGYKLNNLSGAFEFFIPMTQAKIYYQVEYINGEKSPVFSLELSSPDDSGTIYQIALPSTDAIPLFLLDGLPGRPLMLVAATNSDVTALDWQIYPNINNAFTVIGTWYHSLLSDGLNSQETVKLIAKHKDGSTSQYQYSLKLKSKHKNQRLAKNKLRVRELFYCDSRSCSFTWLRATQDDIATIDDILVGVKSDQLVSISNGDLELLSVAAENQRLTMLANEEAKIAKQPKVTPLSFGTPVNNSGEPSLITRLQSPVKFKARENWQVREQTQTSRFISYSVAISPMFIQFKWQDGTYSKVMIVHN